MDDFGEWERETRELFLILGHEVAAAAVALRARYVSAQVQLAANTVLVLTYEQGRVWVTGKGFELELTALSEW